MELFSEVFGVYYQVVSKLLHKTPMTRREIQKLVAEGGFAESSIHLLPHLLDEKDWPFLREENGIWYSQLEHPPSLPITKLELCWLKAVLQDPRARLFFSDEEWSELCEKLSGVDPLFNWDQFCYFDQCLDGDPYKDEDYRKNFQQILQAVREKSVLEIAYYSGEKHKVNVQCFLPLRVEYSEKDNKFRVLCARIRNGVLLGYSTLNLGRIQTVKSSEERYNGPIDLDGWIARSRRREPVVLEVRTERNGVERFLVEFSSYEKKSEYDRKNDVCRVTLWYSNQDETEVLIRILGFGPVVRVLSPSSFVEKLRQRVERQIDLISRTSGTSGRDTRR